MSNAATTSPRAIISRCFIAVMAVNERRFILEPDNAFNLALYLLCAFVEELIYPNQSGID